MRSVLVGFDSFDPSTYESLANKNELPNLTALAGKSGYSRLKVCAPPQTEVSWTSIATGSDPGTHGIFDFVHRDPATYVPYVSILPTKQSAVGEQFIPPYTAKTIFSEAADMGYPAIALWWPALFPARLDMPISTIPGLGTPDVRGQLGVGTYATSDPAEKKEKTRVAVLKETSKGKYAGALDGPMTKTREGLQPAKLDFSLDILNDAQATLRIGTVELPLKCGQWSPIFEIKFKLGLLFNVTAITKVILTQIRGKVGLYFLPLQIHPLHSTWHYGAPKSFIKDSWTNGGPFLTLGWPQDTTALEEDCITDEQFLGLCDSIFESRKKVFYYHLSNMKEGVLAGVFDCLDRVQHMFLRDREDIVHDWYRRLDGFVGEARGKMSSLGMDKARFLVMSDHGFKNFGHKVHLNRWLAGNNYLSFSSNGGEDGLQNVNWAETSAYALGLNSIYLNVKGREGKGRVTAEQVEPLLAEIKTKLLDLRGPGGKNAVSSVLFKHEAFSGPYLRLGPDLVVGYAPNYRASSETGLGKAPQTTLEVNTDHWGADHCIDAEAVPGVLFANRDVANIPEVSFRDIPLLMIGKHLDQSYLKPPSEQNRQGQENIEERLKGLGYL
ncbi:MAG: alkaline phosphatase family protein [Chloroflexi bacterium]|nr:alkaline phosphatase family protein [Chloroflexota bacterium]